MNSTSTQPPIYLDSSPAAAHGLGYDYAPPRALYVTHIPAILLLTGLFTWMVGTEPALVFAAMVGAAVAVYMLWDWLINEGPTRFSTLLAMTLLLGYGLGAVNTWLTLPRSGLSLTNFLGTDEGIIARAMAAVLIVSAPLCFLGELYERPLFGSEFRLPLDHRTYLFIFLGTASVVVGFFTKQIGYMGGQVSSGELTVAAALLTWMFPPLTGLTIAIFVATRGRFMKLLTGGCMLILCALLMVIGRRTLIYTSVLVLFTLRLTGYRLRGTFFRKLLLLAGLGFFLAVGVTVFMLLRLAGFAAHSSENISLGQRIQIAMSWVEEGTALKRATEANQTNAQKRTFVLGFFADVLEASMKRTPALGKDLAGYTSMAIPRVLNPDKDLFFTEERLVDSQFGLTYGDAANSILTNGATDFSLLGVIFYPLILVWLFRFCVDLLSGFLPALPVSFIALGIIFNLLQTENSIDLYLITIRNVIIFAAILLIFSRLPQFRLRS